MAADGSSAASRTERGSEVAEVLADHLLAGRTGADAGHIFLALVAVVFYRPMVGTGVALGWLAVFLAAAGIRGLVRKRRIRTEPDTRRRQRWVRWDVWGSALVWTPWPLLLIGDPAGDLIVLLMLVLGLVAGATATLVADRSAFLGFSLTLYVPLIVTLALGAGTRLGLALLVLSLGYLPFMYSVWNRAHSVLVHRTEAVMQLSVAREGAAQAARFLESVVNSLPVAVAILDDSDRVVSVNKSFERSFRTSASGVEGQGFASLVGTEEGQPRLEEFLLRSQLGAVEDGEFQLRRRDGSEVPMHLFATAGDGHANGRLVVVGQDISQEVEIRETLIRAREVAEEANRGKTAFVANMGHQFKTPLNSVIGFSELLMNTAPEELGASQRDRLEAIHRSGRELKRLVEDVLEFSTLTSGMARLQRVTVDVPSLLRDVVRGLPRSEESRSVRVDLRIDPSVDEMRLVADPQSLARIVRNLLTNALGASPEGGRVDVRASWDSRRLTISVADEGPGVPVDDRERIFERFERGRGVGDSAGVGLGLPIARQLAELHGGTISVADREGGPGACFTVTVEASVHGGEAEL